VHHNRRNPLLTTQKTFDNGDIQTIPFEQALSGGAVLAGFELKLADIFTA
jgi:hypothetical protein